MSSSKEEVVEMFRKYCAGCEGHGCCVGGELNLFGWELEKLQERAGPNFVRRRRSLRHMGRCHFAQDEGCCLNMDDKPLDCVSYPVYPAVEYLPGGEKRVAGLMVHRSCPSCGDIAGDGPLLKSLKSFWESEIKVISSGDMKDWYSDGREYWSDLNVIKVSV